MPDAKRIKVFHDSDEEETAANVQPLTEFSGNTLSKPEQAPLIVPKLPDTFRHGNKSYVPGAMTQATKRFDGKTIDELEAEERSRNRAYGLSVTASSQRRGEGSLLIDESPDSRLESSSKHMQDADVSTLDDYEAVPVESFGLAMLRGMGYDPSEVAKPEAKAQERRPDFLGLGATQRPMESKTSADLAKKRHEVRKEERTYVPVVKINKRTGERVDEGAVATAPTQMAASKEALTERHVSKEARPNLERHRRPLSSSRHRSRSGSRSPSRRARKERDRHQRCVSRERHSHKHGSIKHDSDRNKRSRNEQRDMSRRDT